MSIITKSSTVSMDVNSAMVANYISGLTAGSAINAGDACYIDSNSKVLVSGSAVVSGSLVCFAGFAPKAYAANDAITLYGKGVRFDYSTGLTPGQYLFVSGSAGGMSTTANTGDLPVALTVSTTDIVCVR